MVGASFITIFEWGYFKLLKDFQRFEYSDFNLVCKHTCKYFPIGRRHAFKQKVDFMLVWDGILRRIAIPHACSCSFSPYLTLSFFTYLNEGVNEISIDARFFLFVHAESYDENPLPTRQQPKKGRSCSPRSDDLWTPDLCGLWVQYR